MTVPIKYINTFIKVKYFLSSYRALHDGRCGISELENRLESSENFLSNWKVLWLGTCSTLRIAINLFSIDSKSCINSKIRIELASEWNNISKNKKENQIFWDFLKKERDSVMHGYQWRSYEAWMKPDGTFRAPNMSLLVVEKDDAKPVLLIDSGPFKGRNSVELLKESADWIEDRIYSAIRRAGYEPDEKRNVVNFERKYKSGLASSVLVSGTLSGASEAD